MMALQVQLIGQAWLSVFFFEFFSHLLEANAESPDGCMNGYSTLLSPAKQLDHGKIPTLPSSAKQGLELNRQYHPVGDPIAKSGAAIQASGLLYVTWFHIMTFIS